MTYKEPFNKERSLTRAYQVKLESVNYNDNGTAVIRTYQSQEIGKIEFTASGERSVGFRDRQSEILYCNAQLIGESAVSAYVISITATGMTIFSQISGTVYYNAIGSNP